MVFLLYGFLLIPLGNYKNPEQPHPGYYNIQNIDPGDDTGFYAYLRSGVIDKDFDFFNEKRFWHFNSITQTGYTANYWYIGAPIIWLPFFLVGHGVAWLYGLLGYPVAMDGYAFPYHAFTFLASACEVLVALVLCYKSLEKFYSPSASLTATLLLFTSTCLPYFTFIRNRMSHTGDMLAGFVFFLLFLKFREHAENKTVRHPGSHTDSAIPRLAYFMFWGSGAGLLVDLRYISVIYCVLPLGMAVKIFLASETSGLDKRRLQQGLGLAFLAFLITISPQLAAWKKLHGVFSSLNPFTVALQPNFTSLMSSIWELFFGGTRGLALTEPVWLFGLAGLALLLRKDRLLGGLCFLLFLGFCVAPLVIGDPATLGQRYLIPAFPALAMGLAHLIDLLFKRKLHAVVFVATGALALWLYTLLLNYLYLLVFNDPNFALRSFQNIPLLISKNLILAPTSYLDLFLKVKPVLADHLDYFFLIIFPALFVGISLLLSTLARNILKTCGENESFQFSFFRNTSVMFLLGMACLTTFILTQHPELSPETKKHRLQISAVCELTKDLSNEEGVHKLLLRGEQFGPSNEMDYLIRADASLIKRNFDRAREFYLKAVALNEHSTALLQLDRIEMIVGRKSGINDLLQKFKQEDDPTGENTRWAGIYVLDQQLKPNETVSYFTASLQINPRQQHAEGMKRVIAHHQIQTRRLQERGIDPREVPIEFNLMLNTEFTEARLNSCMIPQRF